MCLVILSGNSVRVRARVRVRVRVSNAPMASMVSSGRSEGPG